MSAEQDQRPKSAASSKKSEDQQRGHQLSDDGPVAAGQQDAYHQLSDDQPEAGADGEQQQQQKADKPKKENPLKKFMASLKSLNCTGKPSGDKKNKTNGSASQEGEDDDDNNTPNARPVSQGSLESKKVATEKNAPQIDVSPAVEDDHQTGESHKEEQHKDGEEKKEDNEKIASPVDAHPPALTTTAISATPPTL